MEKQLTHLEAWADFWKWIKEQPGWADIERGEKQYLYKTEKAARDSELGYIRVKNILTTYAPDRYAFREAVILKDDV